MSVKTQSCWRGMWRTPKNKKKITNLFKIERLRKINETASTSEMNTTNYTKHDYSSKSNAIYLVRLEESPLP